MTQILITIAAFVVAISILVAVHEFGHFWVARRLGFKVLRFSIGFGKPLLRWQSKTDETEFMISAVPLGGYVKMLDEREGPVAEEEVHRAFNRQTPAKRLAVLVAGPAFNFLFAVFAYWVLFVAGVSGLRPVIGNVVNSSPAAIAGLHSGDEIISIGDKAITTWDQVPITLIEQLLDGGRIALRVDDGNGERGVLIDVADQATELSDPSRLFSGLGFNRWFPDGAPVIGGLAEGGSAQAAGLEVGDLVISADGETFEKWSEWSQYVRARPGETMELIVERNGERLPLNIVIRTMIGESGEFGRAGVTPDVKESDFAHLQTVHRLGPINSLSEAVSKTWDMSTLTLRLLGRMVVGDISPKNISGPISIATYAGMAASLGLEEFLGLLAVLSISLGIINLLPIPLLDGGQMVYVTAEAIKGRPLSDRAQLTGQQIGIAMLILIMGFAFYNDINRLIG